MCMTSKTAHDSLHYHDSTNVLSRLNTFDGAIYCYGSEYWNYLKVGRSSMKELQGRLEKERVETTCPETTMLFIFLSSNHIELEKLFKRNFNHLMINQKELFKSAPLDTEQAFLFRQFLVEHDTDGQITNEDEFNMIIMHRKNQIKSLASTPMQLQINSARLETTRQNACSEGDRLQVLLNMFGEKFCSSVFLMRISQTGKRCHIRSDILFNCRKSSTARLYRYTDLVYDISKGSLMIVGLSPLACKMSTK